MLNNRKIWMEISCLTKIRFEKIMLLKKKIFSLVDKNIGHVDAENI